MATKQVVFENGNSKSSISKFVIREREQAFRAMPESSTLHNPPFLSACMLDGLNTLLVVLGGQDRVGAAFELTTLFKEIDPEVTICGSFMAPIVENFSGLFFLVRHETDADKLVPFRLELEKRFGEIPRDLPAASSGRFVRFVVIAPDRPGVLNKVTAQLAKRGLNIKKQTGSTFTRFVGSRPKEFARLRFKVSVPDGKEDAFEEFVTSIEMIGPEFEVRRK